jgi:anti-sigma factor RsiW
MDEALFAYAAGSLNAEGRRRVELLIESDPAAAAKLAWYSAVCDGLVETLPALEDLPSAGTVSARIQDVQERIATGKPSRGLARLFAWLAGPALRPAAAFAAVLIVLQGAIIGMLATDRDRAQTRAIAPAPQSVVFVVAFDPGATEAGIRGLLLEAGATIVGGPRQLGDYRVAVPANRAQFAKSVLEQSRIVEYVRPEQP